MHCELYDTKKKHLIAAYSLQDIYMRIRHDRCPNNLLYYSSKCSKTYKMNSKCATLTLTMTKIRFTLVGKTIIIQNKNFQKIIYSSRCLLYIRVFQNEKNQLLSSIQNMLHIAKNTLHT